MTAEQRRIAKIKKHGWPKGLRDEDYCIWCGDFKAASDLGTTTYMFNGEVVSKERFVELMGPLDDHGHPGNSRSPVNPMNRLLDARYEYERYGRLP